MEENSPISIDRQLTVELEAWKHNRILYPGWLIAPKETRDRVWNYTYNWTRSIYDAKDKWNPTQLLILYREFFWRLDISLQYLPDEIADAADMILHTFETFGKYSFHPAMMEKQWPISLTLTATELKEYWLSVAFYVLRNFRITRNKAQFIELKQKIIQIESNNDEIIARIKFETCLWTLSENDREACLNELKEWPLGPADPYWQVKRGALYAELGDFSTAKSLMETALVTLRSTQRLGLANISAMSRESWTLHHLQQLSVARISDLTMRTDSEKRRDRQRALEAYRCSAEVELRLLRSTIQDRAKPHYSNGHRDTSPDFDHGITRSSFQWSTRPLQETLAPALNVLMMIEQTGLPPHLRSHDRSFGVSLFADTYRQSLEWLQEDFSALWASWAPRFDFAGMGDGKLSRQTVESLPIDNVQALFLMAHEQLISHLDQAKPRSAELLGLRHWVELATRLASRLDDESLELLVTVALTGLKNSQFLSHHVSRNYLDALLGRSLPYLKEPMVEKWLTEMLGSPLPPCNPFDGWQELFEILDKTVLQSLAARRKDEANSTDSVVWFKIENEIERLIELVAKAPIDSRCSALFRLAPLNNSGFLTETERAKLANALWAQRDDRGLPVLPDEIIEAICLEIPQKEPEQSIHLLLDWLDHEKITPRFNVDKTGQTNAPSISSSDKDRFLPNLYRIILFIRHNSDYKNIITEKRATSYIKKILEWWSLESNLYIGHQNELIDPTDRLEYVIDILGMALLSAIASNIKIRSRVLLTVKEFIESGITEARLAPILTFLDEKNSDHYVSVLTAALASDNRRTCHEAILAVYQWERDRAGLNLIPLPANTLSSVCFIAQGLVPPGAKLAIHLLGSLVEIGTIEPNAIGAKQIQDAVATACENLSFTVSKIGTGRLDPEELPHIRRELARTIRKMTSAGFNLNSVIREWIVGALHDPFVDVRHAAESAIRNLDNAISSTR